MSERDLTAAVKTAIEETVIYPIVLAQLAFPSDTVRIWTGQGQISWNAQTWDGTGDVVSFSTFPETTDGSAQGVQIDLSGINSATISDITEDEFQGSSVDVWVGFTDSNGNVIADPFKLFGGQMDTGEINDNGETATITINAESRLINQLKRRQWRYTHEDQKKLYAPTVDKGLEFVSKIQDKEIVWKA